MSFCFALVDVLTIPPQLQEKLDISSLSFKRDTSDVNFSNRVPLLICLYAMRVHPSLTLIDVTASLWEGVP